MTGKLSQVLLVTMFLTLPLTAQMLPAKIKSYLNGNYSGWNLEPGCEPDRTAKSYLSGDFNGDHKLDYVVKFSRGEKGFIVAFLAQTGHSYKPFVLHYTDAKEVQYSTLMLREKGERFSSEDVSFRLKYDAPADYRCESDVGGIHYFRNGKFIGY